MEPFLLNIYVNDAMANLIDVRVYVNDEICGIFILVRWFYFYFLHFPLFLLKHSLYNKNLNIFCTVLSKCGVFHLLEFACGKVGVVSVLMLLRGSPFHLK